MSATETTKMTERKDDRLWGGRFERAPNAGFDAFQRSFAFDRRLLPYELAVDRAWAKALEGVGILNAEEVRQTLAALDRIAERAHDSDVALDFVGCRRCAPLCRESAGRRVRRRWDGNYIPGAAAMNWWPRIFACSSKTRRPESKTAIVAADRSLLAQAKMHRCPWRA